MSRHTLALSDRATIFWVNALLVTISLNAVLIQTLIPQESAFKYVVRGVIVAVTLILHAARRTVIPIWIMIAALMSVSLLIATQNTDQLTIVFILLLVPLLWSIPRRSLDAAATRASIFALTLIFLFLLFGFTHNELSVSSTPLTPERERYTFGTYGVPFFMNVVYGATAMVVYYAFRWRLRTRWFWMLAAVAIVGFLYAETNGRGGFTAFLILCVLMLVMPILIRIPGASILIALQPVLYLGITLWVAAQSQSNRWNSLLSFRPKLLGDYLTNVNPWSFLISSSVKQNTIVATVDNSYLQLLIGGGIANFIFFCIIFAVAIRNLTREHMTLEIAFVSATMIYGISEGILLRIENVFIIFTWFIILYYAFSPHLDQEKRPVNRAIDHSRKAA